MFGNLTQKLTSVFSSFAGKKSLTEENISEAVREVRLALLEADVNYGVTKTFIAKVKEKALGEAVLKAVAPGQQFIQVIHEELVQLMGGGEAVLLLTEKPSVIMLCGLQGSGKTTQAGKLAHYLRKHEKKKKILLAACDLQRPAAIEQLKVLGRQLEIPVFNLEGEKNPVKVAQEAFLLAKKEQYEVLIVDTAGRLHIDDDLMKELEQIKRALQPQEILFVANGATGQDAVTTAAEFEKRLGLTGSILTMLDGDTRGGAAISIQQVTQKPLKFEGIGEKLEDLQLFNARSMADRILGMGDTINLVKKAKEHISEEEAKNLETKIRKATFTYNDYLNQMQAVRKMGSFKGLMKMLPGAAKIPNFDQSEKEFFKIEAIILSMNPRERQEKDDLSMGRMKRIAKGSGTKLTDVTNLKNSFKRSKQFFKNMPNNKMLEKFMGGR